MARPPLPNRPRQELPQDTVMGLLSVIRSQFYGDADQKRWYQDQNFLLRKVVLWPASWLDRRGVTLSPTRYREIVQDILRGIKQHGATGVVKYWPGYLAHCVQEHFRHHGDEIYEEAKSFRVALDRATFALDRAAEASRQADPIRAMAAAQAVLARTSRRKRRPETRSAQADLPL